LKLSGRYLERILVVFLRFFERNCFVQIKCLVDEALVRVSMILRSKIAIVCKEKNSRPMYDLYLINEKSENWM
jgi:hypothetical protein